MPTLKSIRKRPLSLENLEDRSVPAAIGYYDMDWGYGVWTQPEAILKTGNTPVGLNNVGPSDLAGLDVLDVQNGSNWGFGGEYLSHLADIQNAVSNGLVLIIHDRWVDNVGGLLPGGSGIHTVRDFSDNSNINVLDPNSLVANGPGGVLNDQTLDGYNSSSHGYTVAASLPQDAHQLLSRGNPSEVVAFSYSYGAGSVYYS